MGEQAEGGRGGPASEGRGRAPGPRYDERGLVPAIVQDARTREVLTLAYVNGESLRRTLETGETWFWSRSRRALWHKGETSGNTQRVVGLTLDCDLDALLVEVEPAGPACHTGRETCFHMPLDGAPADPDAADVADLGNTAAGIADVADAAAGAANAVGGGVGEREGEAAGGFGGVVESLYAVVEGRRREMPEGSYTTYLFEQGLNKILKKVGEESAETIIAAKDGDDRALTSEISDLIYHLVVLMVERGQSLEAVAGELRLRAAGRGAR